MTTFPDPPAGYGIPLVDLNTKLLPDPTMTALDERYLPGDTGWVLITTFAAGWSTPNTDPLRVRRIGRQIFLTGTVVRATTAAPVDNICTIPPAFRSTTGIAALNIGMGVASSNSAFIGLSYSLDTHRITFRRSGALPTGANEVFYIEPCQWFKD